MLSSLGEGELPMEEHPLRATRGKDRLGRSALGYPWDFSARSGDTEVALSVCLDLPL